MDFHRSGSCPIRRWPEIHADDGRVRGDVKTVSVQQLKSLMRDAIGRGWSPHGRPEWIAEHAHVIDRIVLVLFGPDAPGRYRCTVVAFSKRGDGMRMMLDTTEEAFDALPDVSLEELVLITRLMLDGCPMVPKSESEQDTYQR